MRVFPDHDRRDAAARPPRACDLAMGLWLGAPVLFAALVPVFFPCIAVEFVRRRLRRSLSWSARTFASARCWPSPPVVWPLDRSPPGSSFPKPRGTIGFTCCTRSFSSRNRTACFRAAWPVGRPSQVFWPPIRGTRILGIGYKTLPYSDFIGQPIVADNMYLSLSGGDRNCWADGVRPAQFRHPAHRLARRPPRRFTHLRSSEAGSFVSGSASFSRCFRATCLLIGECSHCTFGFSRWQPHGTMP